MRVGLIWETTLGILGSQPVGGAGREEVDGLDEQLHIVGGPGLVLGAPLLGPVPRGRGPRQQLQLLTLQPLLQCPSLGRCE